MLDVTLILQEAEALLDDHYATWQQHGSGRVRVYHASQKHQIPVTVKAQDAHPPAPSNQERAASSSTTSFKAGELGEVVANVFVLILLGVLSERLARRGSR
ncbi:MAG: hypothetical protein U0175_36025 [Caldilineaceae bacterium]